MNAKGIWLIGIVLVAVLGIVVAYSVDNPTAFSSDENRTTLNVSSEGPIELSRIVEDVKSAQYYKGYDNETLNWMESLGDKYVFSSSGEFVVMDKADSDRIPSVYACDVSFNEIFSCNVLENHSLGNVKYPRDVLLVEDVEYIGEEAHYYEV